MRFFHTLIASLALALTLTGPAAAASDRDSAPMSAAADTVFTELERRIICEYFKSPVCNEGHGNSDDNDAAKDHKGGIKNGNGKGRSGKSAMLPPGLAKRAALPPGLQAQLVKNGTLPPGLAKRSIPSDLAAKLPNRHEDIERIIVGDDLLLVRRGTEIILDILEGVAGKNSN